MSTKLSRAVTLPAYGRGTHSRMDAVSPRRPRSLPGASGRRGRRPFPSASRLPQAYHSAQDNPHYVQPALCLCALVDIMPWLSCVRTLGLTMTSVPGQIIPAGLLRFDDADS